MAHLVVVDLLVLTQLLLKLMRFQFQRSQRIRLLMPSLTMKKVLNLLLKRRKKTKLKLNTKLLKLYQRRRRNQLPKKRKAEVLLKP